MRDLAAFDRRLAAAVRGLADGADTHVDAAAVAEDAANRRTRTSWLLLPLPVPASFLVACALVLVLLAWSIGAGAPRPASAPLNVQGRVTGVSSISVVRPGLLDSAEDASARVRGLVLAVADAADDPRAAGTGLLALDIDQVGTLGFAVGSLRIASEGGTWEGTCRGTTWDAGAKHDVTCWLMGSGDHAGLTYYRHARMTDDGVDVNGLIVPAPPPAP